MKTAGTPQIGIRQKASAVIAWLGFSTLTLVILIQVYEIVRTLSHLLMPAHFEQEVASRWRPVVVTNAVLVGGALAWLWSVVYTLNRFLGTPRAAPLTGRQTIVRLLLAVFVVTCLYGAERWLWRLL